MSEITMSEVTELTEPILRPIAQRIINEAKLAIEKVAANHTQASKFPIATNPESFENVFHSRFNVLPPVIKKTASEKAIASINAPIVVRTKHFGDLSSVDLSSATSIDEQVKAMPFPSALKFSASELTKLANQQEAVAAVGSVTDKLKLRIHKVKCVDETNGPFGTEIGSDEIDLGGSTVDETGDVKKVNPFRVGDNFDDGDQKVYSPPKQFTYFNLLEGSTYPKSYFVTLVLSEVDGGGFSNFINKLLNLLKDKVKAAILAAGPFGGPIGDIIGRVVGYVINRIFDFILSLWSDDVFPPVTVALKIPSLGLRWPGNKTDSPEGIITYSGFGGRYQLTYDWQMYA